MIISRARKLRTGGITFYPLMCESTSIYLHGNKIVRVFFSFAGPYIDHIFAFVNGLNVIELVNGDGINTTNDTMILYMQMQLISQMRENFLISECL